MKKLVVTVVGLGLVATGCASDGGTNSQSPEHSTSAHQHEQPADQISFALDEQNGSGQSGLSIAYPSGDDRSVITISLQGAPAAGGAAQKAAVLTGSCADPGKVVAKLADVEGGGSFTQFEGTLADYVSAKNIVQVTTTNGDAVACGVIEDGDVHPPSVPIPSAHRLEIKEQNLSGQSGEAILTPSDDGQTTSIVITWNNQPADIEQLPTHIHQSKCATLDPMVMVPLANIIDNKSTTNDIPVPLSKLLEDDSFSINVHHDPSALPFYVGCGTISDATPITE